jgi:hypothetical protein
MGENKNKRRLGRWWLILVLIIMIVGYSGIFYLISTCVSSSDSEAKYALIVTSSIVICIVSFVLATMILKTGGISNKNEALGLPSGSIRSFIALILICIFFIISIIMYNGAEGNYVRVSVPLDVYKNMPNTKILLQIDSVRNHDYDTLETGYRTRIKIKPKISLTSGQQDTLSKLAEKNSIKTKVPVYTVEQLEPNTSEANDFAKAFQTGFMTLISAICAFYFGTKTVADSSKSNSQDKEGGKDDKLEVKLITKLPPSLDKAKGESLIMVFETTPSNSYIIFSCTGDTANTSIIPDATDRNKFTYKPTDAVASTTVTLKASLVSNPDISTSFDIKIV